MICALANDMPDHRRSGVIFIGQNDDLSCANLAVTDDLLLRISGWCSDGINRDPARLAWLKDYRSLMPMAMEVNKPIFKLTTSDGAIGGHQAGVQQAYDDFEALCEEILSRIDD